MGPGPCPYRGTGAHQLGLRPACSGPARNFLFLWERSAAPPAGREPLIWVGLAGPERLGAEASPSSRVPLTAGALGAA